MDFEQFKAYNQFRKAWDSVKIYRTVPYSLFTFGDSDLPYFLVCSPPEGRSTVSIRQGNVKVSRPLIITPGDAPSEFHDFFEDQEDEELARFLLSRTARFRNLQFNNVVQSEHFVSDSVEEAADRINRKLDEEEEDRVGILTAPAGLGGVAVFRYSLERVAQSTPDNVTELREHGFLP